MKIKRRRKNKTKRVNKVPINERRLSALKLRQKGMSYDRIAKQLGINIGSAYQDVMAALNEIDSERKEEADKLRVLEITRLDRLVEKLEAGLKKRTMQRVVGKGAKAVVVEYTEQEIDLTAFVMSYIKIMDRRSRYIAGLDAPIKTEQDVSERLKAAMEGAGEDVITVLKRLAGEK